MPQEGSRESVWTGYWLPVAAIVCWCFPAVAINVAHGLRSGSEPAIILLSIFAVFFTALCALRLEQPSAPGIRALAALLVLIGVTYNLTNAVGLVAHHSEQSRSAAMSQQKFRHSLQDELTTVSQQITALNAALGDRTIPILTTEISALERNPIFDRTKSCMDATLGESREHCASWDKARQLLKAAERREVLQRKHSNIAAELRTAPVRESVDPKVDAVARALLFVGIEVDGDDVRYGMILLPAVIAELMAAFGAAMCGVQLPSRRHSTVPEEESRRRETHHAETEKKSRSAEKRQLSPADLVERFLKAHVQTDNATCAVRASELYMAFRSWWICHAPGRQVPSQITLGQAMSAKGYTRSRRGGISRYENVRLLSLAG